MVTLKLAVNILWLSSCSTNKLFKRDKIQLAAFTPLNILANYIIAPNRGVIFNRRKIGFKILMLNSLLVLSGFA